MTQEKSNQILLREAIDTMEEIQKKLKRLDRATLFIILGAESHLDEDSIEVYTFQLIRDYLHIISEESIKLKNQLLDLEKH